MPEKIKEAIFKCAKCTVTGNYKDITAHEVEFCLKPPDECDYNLKYNTSTLNNSYRMWHHIHNRPGDITTCNSIFKREQEQHTKFSTKLKCAEGHPILLVSNDNGDSYVTFTCGRCTGIVVDLDLAVIGDSVGGPYLTNTFSLYISEILDTDLSEFYNKTED